MRYTTNREHFKTSLEELTYGTFFWHANRVYLALKLYPFQPHSKKTEDEMRKSRHRLCLCLDTDMTVKLPYELVVEPAVLNMKNEARDKKPFHELSVGATFTVGNITAADNTDAGCDSDKYGIYAKINPHKIGDAHCNAVNLITGELMNAYQECVVTELFSEIEISVNREKP